MDRLNNIQIKQVEKILYAHQGEINVNHAETADYATIAGNAELFGGQPPANYTTQEIFETHINDFNAHGATSEANPERIILRDSEGKANICSPSVALNIANKAYVDDGLILKASCTDLTWTNYNINSHIGCHLVHCSTYLATPSRIILRDGNGRARVCNPSDNLDIANKQYTDSLFGESVQKNGDTMTGVLCASSGIFLPNASGRSGELRIGGNSVVNHSISICNDNLTLFFNRNCGNGRITFRSHTGNTSYRNEAELDGINREFYINGKKAYKEGDEFSLIENSLIIGRMDNELVGSPTFAINFKCGQIGCHDEYIRFVVSGNINIQCCSHTLTMRGTFTTAETDYQSHFIYATGTSTAITHQCGDRWHIFPATTWGGESWNQRTFILKGEIMRFRVTTGNNCYGFGTFQIGMTHQTPGSHLGTVNRTAVGSFTMCNPLKCIYRLYLSTGNSCIRFYNITARIWRMGMDG
jgi:hypothetical protein